MNVRPIDIERVRTDDALREKLAALTLRPRGAMVHWLEYVTRPGGGGHVVVATMRVKPGPDLQPVSDEIVGWGMAMHYDAPDCSCGALRPEGPPPRARDHDPHD